MVLVLRTVGVHASHVWCLLRTRHRVGYNAANKDGGEEVFRSYCRLQGRVSKNYLCVRFL